MKRIGLLSIILLATQITSAIERPYIISGFDDVLRQADNRGLIKAAVKIFEKDLAFSGMAELYSGIASTEIAPKFSIVSDISTMFDNRMEDFLQKSKFQTHDQYFRRWLTEWSIEKFKLKKIGNIVSSKPNRKFIIIFDNSDASISMVNTIHKRFPEKVHTVYLHQVVTKKSPKGSTPYFTAFDIALNEYRSGRLGPETVRSVGLSILKEKQPHLIFPSYAYCPLSYKPCLGAPGAVQDICTQVREYTNKLCSNHKK